MGIEELNEGEQKLAKAIIAGVRHESCQFIAEDRKILHEYIESVKKESADGETLVIIFRIGNNIRDGAKTFMKWFVWLFMLAVAFVFYHLTVKHWIQGGK